MEPKLPDVENLLRLCKSVALLDAILMPEWQYRYYSFNARWSAGTQMASMRDGCGDGYFILFDRHGAILKGYAHESPAARWVADHGSPLPGMFDGVPDEFSGFLSEPAFSIQDTSFCRWRRYTDAQWLSGRARYPGADAGGADELLMVLEGDPTFYARWAKEYYEVPVDVASVRRVYRHDPLTEELVHALNPQVTLTDLAEDVAEIGYGV